MGVGDMVIDGRGRGDMVIDGREGYG